MKRGGEIVIFEVVIMILGIKIVFLGLQGVIFIISCVAYDFGG